MLLLNEKVKVLNIIRKENLFFFFFADVAVDKIYGNNESSIH